MSTLDNIRLELTNKEIRIQEKEGITQALARVLRESNITNFTKKDLLSLAEEISNTDPNLQWRHKKTYVIGWVSYTAVDRVHVNDVLHINQPIVHKNPIITEVPSKSSNANKPKQTSGIPEVSPISQPQTGKQQSDIQTKTNTDDVPSQMRYSDGQTLQTLWTPSNLQINKLEGDENTLMIEVTNRNTQRNPGSRETWYTPTNQSENNQQWNDIIQTDVSNIYNLRNGVVDSVTQQWNGANIVHMQNSRSGPIHQSNGP